MWRLFKLILMFSSMIGFVICQIEILDKFEGAKCKSKGVGGTCVNIFKCESARMYLERKDFPPICSYQGKEPVICCTDCNTVNDTRKIIFNSRVGNLYLRGPKARDECMHYIDKLEYDCKINTTASYLHLYLDSSDCHLTGTSVKPAQGKPPRKETYLALLGYGAELKTAEWQCAGAVISDKYILTAAHCLVDPSLGPVKYVALGIQNRTDPPEMWQHYGIKTTIPHPEYTSPSKYHDIALLETDKRITFNSDVLPACVNTDETELFNADILVWDSKPESKGALQPVTLSALDSFSCSALFYPPKKDELQNGYNETIQYCVGDTVKPDDSCQSPNGGPLIGVYREESCATVILGISSSERVCGALGSSGLFTKVLFYVPWIETIVWP